MEDQLGALEKRMDDVQRQLVDLRREIVEAIGRSFKWTIVILAFAAVVTWFGVFLIMRGGLVRQLLSN